MWIINRLLDSNDPLHIVLSFSKRSKALVRSADMAFQGTWQVYLQENYEEFLRAIREFLRPILPLYDQGCISPKHRTAAANGMAKMPNLE